MPGAGPVLHLEMIIVSDLLNALALVLVIEGILPFLSPRAMRNMMTQMIQLEDRTLRITGLFSMLTGLGLLLLLR